MKAKGLERQLEDLGIEVRRSSIQFHSSSLFPLYRWQVERSDGRSEAYALKRVDSREMALAEADGLQMLRSHGARVPAIVGVLSGDDGASYLAMQFIEHRAVDRRRAQQDLLSSLRSLYSVTAEYFGYHRFNYVGSLKQQNGRHERFADFWWQDRIDPMLRRCHALGRLGRVDSESLHELIVRCIEGFGLGEARPVPVHGDLWSGNVLFSGGEAFLIDPSVAFSLPEQDLAMLELFGSPLTSEHYRSLVDVPADLLRKRIEFFQLYPLLVHVVLFGGSYERQTGQLIQGLASELTGRGFPG